ncbi:MAG: carbamoyltransferase [Deltaproteobacteria bacterium]|nr:carbamoyltransferase [Deltaproteobacteria bacterium]
MNILGISAYHGDCSSTLIRDGVVLAAVEEERFTRIKHWAGFPEKAIRYCLAEGGVSLKQIDKIAIGRNTFANMKERLGFVFRNRQSMKKLSGRYRNRRSIGGIADRLSAAFDVPVKIIKGRIVNVEHHLAHMASSYMVSPFDDAAILTLDGFGDFVSAMQGYGRKNKMEVLGKVLYPHSIGLFYTMITQFLGFTKYGDEFKVMGLAALGEPTLKKDLKRVIRYIGNGRYVLNLKYFRHHSEGVDMTWDGGEPAMGTVYSHKFIEDFGKPRRYEENIDAYHMDLAASLQAVTEEIIFDLLNDLHEKTRNNRLCLSGGVTMNSVANGKIFDHTPFKEIFIQSAAGDAGTSLGAAYYVYNQILGEPRDFVMNTSYWGPSFGNEEIGKTLQKYDREIKERGCEIRRIDDASVLCRETAQHVAAGEVVGWFQGRMEWGPRALGNRSIIVDPRRPDMQDILNSRIKRRESFRPFAPSILLEYTREYFEKDYPDPFMIKVYPIRNEKRSVIPAVTHVDGTGRLQTVSREENPLYYALIKAFQEITGVPVLLNTSFNENEPIVCTPSEAIDCFLRTKMDVLVMGAYVICRKENEKESG